MPSALSCALELFCWLDAGDHSGSYYETLRCVSDIAKRKAGDQSEGRLIVRQQHFGLIGIYDRGGFHSISKLAVERSDGYIVARPNAREAHGRRCHDGQPAPDCRARRAPLSRSDGRPRDPMSHHSFPRTLQQIGRAGESRCAPLDFLPEFDASGWTPPGADRRSGRAPMPSSLAFGHIRLGPTKTRSIQGGKSHRPKAGFDQGRYADSRSVRCACHPSQMLHAACHSPPG